MANGNLVLYSVGPGLAYPVKRFEGKGADRFLDIGESSFAAGPGWMVGALYASDIVLNPKRGNPEVPAQ